MSSLNDSERATLLDVARRALAAALAGGPAVLAPEADENSPLLAARGAFVTLTSSGNLRGCLGTIEPRWPLWETVARHAVSAATKDPRFEPVQPPELEQLALEISALTPPEPIRAADEVEVGTHGLILEQGFARGLLLPQVAIKWSFSAEQFLEAVSRKAGLAPDAWSRPGVRLYRFEADVFGDRL